MYTEVMHEAGLVKLVAMGRRWPNAALPGAAIEEEVRRMLAEAKAMDAEEDANYGPGRDRARGTDGAAQRLKEAKERLQREADCPSDVEPAGRRRGHRQKEAGAKAQGGRATPYRRGEG